MMTQTIGYPFTDPQIFAKESDDRSVKAYPVVCAIIWLLKFSQYYDNLKLYIFKLN